MHFGMHGQDSLGVLFGMDGQEPSEGLCSELFLRCTINGKEAKIKEFHPQENNLTKLASDLWDLPKVLRNI